MSSFLFKNLNQIQPLWQVFPIGDSFEPTPHPGCFRIDADLCDRPRAVHRYGSDRRDGPHGHYRPLRHDPNVDQSVLVGKRVFHTDFRHLLHSRPILVQHGLPLLVDRGDGLGTVGDDQLQSCR